MCNYFFSPFEIVELSQTYCRFYYVLFADQITDIGNEMTV